MVVRIVFFLCFYFCFYGRSDRIPRAFGYFFVTCTRSRCIYINPRVHRRRMLFDPPPPSHLPTVCEKARDLFGRLKRTGKTPVLCFDKDVYIFSPRKSAQGLLTLIIIFARRMIIYSFIFFRFVKHGQRASSVHIYLLNINYLLYYIPTYIVYKETIERKNFFHKVMYGRPIEI